MITDFVIINAGFCLAAFIDYKLLTNLPVYSTYLCKYSFTEKVNQFCSLEPILKYLN